MLSGNKPRNLLTKREMNQGLLLFGALAIGGIGIVATALVSRSRGRASWRWPNVTGHVLDSSVSTGESASRPVISYAYQVDGRSYSGSKYCFGTEVSFLGPQQAQEIVDQYPRARDVVVYYDPESPGFSVLKPGIPKSNDRLITTGSVIAIIGLFGSLISVMG
jgi:hypothetical protein